MPWGRTDQYDSNDTPQLGIFDSTSSVVLYCEEKAYILVEKAFKIQIQNAYSKGVVAEILMCQFSAGTARTFALLSANAMKKTSIVSV